MSLCLCLFPPCIVHIVVWLVTVVRQGNVFLFEIIKQAEHLTFTPFHWYDSYDDHADDEPHDPSSSVHIQPEITCGFRSFGCCKKKAAASTRLYVYVLNSNNTGYSDVKTDKLNPGNQVEQQYRSKCRFYIFILFLLVSFFHVAVVNSPFSLKQKQMYRCQWQTEIKWNLMKGVKVSKKTNSSTVSVQLPW